MAPKKEVRPLGRLDGFKLSAVAKQIVIRYGSHVHNELAFLKSRTKLRAIAAVVPARPGLGGIRALGLPSQLRLLCREHRVNDEPLPLGCGNPTRGVRLGTDNSPPLWLPIQAEIVAFNIH